MAIILSSEERIAQMGKVVIDPVTGLHYREDSHDLAVIHEVEHAYAGLNIHERDVVIDLGAHIGAFSWYAMRRGAISVYAVEPDPQNFSLLYENRKLPIDDPDTPVGGITIVHAAIYPDCPRGTPLWFCPGRNTGMHSTVRMVGTHSMIVPALSLQQLVDQIHETVTIIKMDIEGAEYVMDWKSMPDSVERLAVEWHFNEDEWRMYFVSAQAWLRVLGFHPLPLNPPGEYPSNDVAALLLKESKRREVKALPVIYRRMPDWRQVATYLQDVQQGL